jgi:hypothetical protein
MMVINILVSVKILKMLHSRRKQMKRMCAPSTMLNERFHTQYGMIYTKISLFKHAIIEIRSDEKESPVDAGK